MTLLVLWYRFVAYFVARLCTISNLCLLFAENGLHTVQQYLTCGLIRALYARDLFLLNNYSYFFDETKDAIRPFSYLVYVEVPVNS